MMYGFQYSNDGFHANGGTAATVEGGRPAPLAIIGYACRLPGGVVDGSSYWRLLAEGRDAISEIPADRWNTKAFISRTAVKGKSLSRWGGFLDQIDLFDPACFGISAREAQFIDPQQRLLLESTYEAFEHAGLVTEQLAGSRTGVFVGVSSLDYSQIQQGGRSLRGLSPFTAQGCTLSIAANRISYCWDLRGPSFIVDTACSSTLVAFDRAAKSLQTGESDMAVVGGANVLITPEIYVNFSQAQMLSPDGRCKAFDASANGFVRAEGAGAFILKRLDDAIRDGDRVWSVVLGTGTNQDGRTGGMAMPSREAQEALLRDVYSISGIDPAKVRYVEAHGTGTAVGDPCEAESIGRFFSPYRSDDQPLFIGSCKTNVGHLEPASGVASLCKVMLMFQHRQIPPNVHFTQPNPSIPFREYKLRVPTSLEPWPDDEPGIVSVNSFGFGGTNAHVILGEYRPEQAPRRLNGDHPVSPRTLQSDRNGEVPDHRQPSVMSMAASMPLPEVIGDSIGATHVSRAAEWPLILSARSDDSLRKLAGAWTELATQENGPSFADLTFTAANRRSQYSHRLALVAENLEEIREQLQAFLAEESRPNLHVGKASDEASVAFVFCGQGPQWTRMGRELIDSEPVFGDAIREIDRLLSQVVGWSLLEELSRDEDQSRIHLTSHAQPALFAIHVALARLWQSWGVQPTVVVGHSVGEIAAAHIAGILSLEEAVRIIGHRGECLQTLGSPGRMIAAEMTEEEARQVIREFAPAVCIAAVNGPKMITFSGETEAFEALEQRLAAHPCWFKPLNVQHAFHSHLVDGAKQTFLERIDGIRGRIPKCEMISTVTGDVIRAADLSAAYWWDNIRRPVRFADAIRKIQDRGISAFLEIGPHPVLAASIRQCRKPQDPVSVILPSLVREKPERSTMLAALGGLFTLGAEIDWKSIWPREQHRVVDLPPHPWSRERFWHESLESRSHRLRPEYHPVLGHEIPGAQRTWENTLDLKVQHWVQDHRVSGRTLVPAAAFVEMLIASSMQLLSSTSVAIDEMFIQRGVFLSPDAAPTLQTVADAAAGLLTIYSRTHESEQNWLQHVQATCRKLNVQSAKARLDIDTWKKAEKGSVQEFYEDYKFVGLDFGPTFRNVRELYRRKDAVLGWIELDETLAGEADQFRIHPALLDGCFQIIFEALSRDDRRTEHILLPERIGRIQFYRSPGLSAWSEVRLTVATAMRLTTGSLRVYTADGELALEVTDFECRAVAFISERDKDDVDTWLYRQRWREQPLAGVELVCQPLPLAPSIGELVAAAQAQADGTWHDEKPESHRAAFEQADRLAMGYFVEALSKMGYSLTAGEQIDPQSLVKSAKLNVSQVPLFAWWLDRLAESGEGVRRDDSWTLTAKLIVPDFALQWRCILSEFPQFYPWLRLIEICGRELAGRFSGDTEPAALLESEEALQLLDQIDRDDPRSRSANAFVQRLCGEFTAQVPADRPIRILEVGAATGGATAFILPALPGDRVEYWFTDRSVAHLSRAEDRFRQHQFVKYQQLDLELDLDLQNIPRRSFDVVIAAHGWRETGVQPNLLLRYSELLTDGGLLAVRDLTRTGPCFELLFGKTNGSAEHASESGRAGGNSLGREQWLTLLKDAGFVEPNVGAGDSDAGTFGTVFVARQPHRASVASTTSSLFDQAPDEKNWLIFADHAGVGQRLAQRLRQLGRRCVVVHGRAIERHSADEFRIDPASAEDMRQLQASAALDDRDLAVVHLWSLDVMSLDPLSKECLNDADALVTHSVLHFLQTWVSSQQNLPRRLVLVTQGCRDAGSDVTLSGVLQGAMPGLARVAMNEFPRLPIQLLDLDCEGDPDVPLWAELVANDSNKEVIWRGNRRLLPRLELIANSEANSGLSAVPPFGLHVARTGDMSSLILREIDDDPPGPGQVQIDVHFVALNFRDLLKALGRYPAEDPRQLELSDECAGIVRAVGAGVTSVSPGDRVVAVGPGTFRSVMKTQARLVSRIPPDLPLAAAVTMPIAYLTAQHGLQAKAQLLPGESVLIHAAAGGVGLAAIQIARSIGATIYASAGSDAKRDLLKKFGVECTLNSRTLDFVDELMTATAGRGVDVVLNSLSGQAMIRSLACVAPFGRFVEIGKRDFYENTRIGLFPLRKCVSYHSIDISALGSDPIRKKLFSLGDVFDVPKLAPPLPCRVIPAALVREAFRLMAGGSHIGKLVLDMTQHWGMVRRKTRKAEIDPGKSWLITGAFGGVGLEVARWLADRGARHLVMLGRSGAKSLEAQIAVTTLESEGIQILAAECDVSDPESLAGLLADVKREMPPLAGIYHLAMVLDDGVIANLDRVRFAKVMAPKSHALWHLHRLTRDCPLEQFVVFSSVSATLGGPGQANYAAANTAMEAMVAHRKSMGFPATVIGWGMLGEVGVVAENKDVKKSLSTFGLVTMSVDDIRNTLDAVVANDNGSKPSLTVAAKVDWHVLSQRLNLAKQPPGLLADLAATATDESLTSGTMRESITTAPPEERRNLMEAFVKSRVARVLGVSPQRIQDSVALARMGLDSLMSVELASMIESDLGISFPLVALAADTTIAMLANGLLKELQSTDANSVAIAESASDAEESAAGSMMQLRDGTGDRPLFCFPPAGGKLGIYEHLIEQMSGDSPVFGLKNANENAESIAELADGFAATIQSAWPNGALRLFGFSFGGLVAIHTASRLEDLGRMVELVGIIECNPRGLESDESREDRLSRLICGSYEEFRRGGLVEAMDPAVLAKEARVVARRFDPQAVVDWALGRLSGEFPRQLVEAYFFRFARDLVLLANYKGRIETPLQSAVHVWSAIDGLGSGIESWRDQAAGDFQHSVLEGDHFSVMHPPYVQALAVALDAVLELPSSTVQATPRHSSERWPSNSR